MGHDEKSNEETDDIPMPAPWARLTAILCGLGAVALRVATMMAFSTNMAPSAHPL